MMSDDEAGGVFACAGSAGGVRGPVSMTCSPMWRKRRGFREYLAGLLLAPRERKEDHALAGAEPVTGSKLPAVQRLQFFLSESVWEPVGLNARLLELLRAGPATAPHGDVGEHRLGDRLRPSIRALRVDGRLLVNGPRSRGRWWRR